MDKQPIINLKPSPLAGVSKADLFKLAEQSRFEDEMMRHVAKLGIETVAKTILLGLGAYDARYMNPVWTIEAVQHLLTIEPFDDELDLVRFKPTGEAFMVIGKPQWPAGEWPDLASIKIEVPYDLIKPQDRQYFSNLNYTK